MIYCNGTNKSCAKWYAIRASIPEIPSIVFSLALWVTLSLVAYYYPLLYPTRFLQGHLGYVSLELRKNVTLIGFILNILRTNVDSVTLVQRILRDRVLNDYCNRRRGVPC